MKILRKIRRRYADDNKFFKYSRYAIGEIILIVIGILIAFQINNWNENRKTRNLEIHYLKRLKNDLVKDTVYFNRRIERANKFIKNNIDAIRLAYQYQNTIEDLQKVLSLQSFYTEHLTIQDDTYGELTTAGNLNIIKNDSLKIAIVAFYRDVEEAEKRVQEYNEFTVSRLSSMASQTMILKYSDRTTDIFNEEKMFHDIDWAFINDPTSTQFRSMESTLLSYINKHKTFKPYFFELKEKSVSLIKLIETELKHEEY